MISCSSNVELRRARPLLGTLVEITGLGANGSVVEEALQAAFAEIDRVQRVFSYHDSTSELSRLNREAACRTLLVSDWMWELLTFSAEIFRASAGAFDPVIAPILERAGLLPRNHSSLATDSGTSFADVYFVLPRCVRFGKKLRLDFGGVAKGFAVDRAVDVLIESGVEAGCVNAGGDVRVFGDRDWPISIRHPGQPGSHVPILNLRDGAVATTANYAARRRLRGRWVAPVVSPGSGRPWLGRSSISVCAPSACVADALTKVVALRGAAASRSVLEKFSAEAHVLPSRRGHAPNLSEGLK